MSDADRPTVRYRRFVAAVAIVYGVVCIGLWPVPLFGLLHAESSAVVAGVGFFASGLAALALFRQGARFGSVLGRMVALLLVPLGLLTLSLLWRPNCGYMQGLGLFVVLAGPSPVLAVALAYALDATVRFRKTWFVTIGVLVAVLPVAWDLGLHPQFYTYNHVWGGVLGPIYDEELAIRSGLFWFRGLTLLWAAALVLLGVRARDRKNVEAKPMLGGRTGWGMIALVVLIGVAYVLGPRLGFNTPGWLIRQHLGGHLATERFDIYYDPASLSDGELGVVVDAHAYRYAQLREALGIDVGERISTYLYPDPATKAALTGARETSVAPVWLPRPQMHLLLSRFDGSFGHELVHVFSREFGLPVLRASPAVGLVEGLAVALEPPDGLPPPDARVAAAARFRDDAGLDRPLAEAVAERLGPLGFWTGRGAVSYTTAGSFVRYLYRTYGPEPLRAVYARGDFEGAYGIPLDSLAAAWQAEVLAAPPDPEAEELVAAVFTRPSLFEQRCPHYVEPWKRAYRAGLGALAAGDAAEAEVAFERALADAPEQPAVLSAWGRSVLAQGDSDRAVTRLAQAVADADTLASAVLWSRLGDAYALAGASAEADSAYARATEATPSYRRSARAVLALRRDASPEAVNLLLDVAPLGERAEALEARGEPAAAVLAALLWVEAGSHAEAVRVLKQVSSQALPDAAVAQRWVWLARFTYVTGDRLDAIAYAERAAQAFAEQGAPYAAVQQRDLVDALWWTLLRSDPVLRLPAIKPRPL